MNVHKRLKSLGSAFLMTSCTWNSEIFTTNCLENYGKKEFNIYMTYSGNCNKWFHNFIVLALNSFAICLLHVKGQSFNL